MTSNLVWNDTRHPKLKKSGTWIVHADVLENVAFREKFHHERLVGVPCGMSESSVGPSVRVSLAEAFTSSGDDVKRFIVKTGVQFLSGQRK
jgi:hypothetical protein